MLTTNPLYGGLALPGTEWIVQYDATGDDVSVEPDAHAQAWAKTVAGSPALSATLGVFNLETSLASEGALYDFADAGFETWDGAYMEAVVRVPTSVSGADAGACIGLELGDAAAIAYLRADGLNLQGAADVPFDMTAWRMVRLGLQGGEARLWVEGRLAQSRGFSYLTTNRRALFGIWPDHGYAETIWRYVQARAFYGGEALWSDALMTIGPEYLIITDLAASLDGTSFTAQAVDHTALAAFTLAEPPVFTMGDETSPVDSGILVECLASADPTGFEVKITNLSWETDLGYGAGLPDIVLKWTRKGLMAP